MSHKDPFETISPDQLTIAFGELDAVVGGAADGSRESNLGGAYASRKLVGSGYIGNDYAKQWHNLQERAHQGFVGLKQPFLSWQGFKSRAAGWGFVREASY
jgi:hypothetical protein